MKIEFRIRKQEMDNAFHYVPENDSKFFYIPEKLELSNSGSMIYGKSKWKPIYGNNLDGFGIYYKYEEAKSEIQKYIKLLKHKDEFIKFPEFTMIIDDDIIRDDIEPLGYDHTFTKFEEILRWCKNVGITDRYLIEGLKNTIKEFRIEKKPDIFNSFQG
jgi:hypothetical protein